MASSLWGPKKRAVLNLNLLQLAQMLFLRPFHSFFFSSTTNEVTFLGLFLTTFDPNKGPKKYVSLWFYFPNTPTKALAKVEQHARPL